MEEHFSNHVEHIVLRSTVAITMVHPGLSISNFLKPLFCLNRNSKFYGPDNPDSPFPEDSLYFRKGGEIKRHGIYDVAREWNLRHQKNPPFRVSVVDTWYLTDNRPETSVEGLHWITELHGDVSRFRPMVGEAMGMSFLLKTN